VVLLDASRYIPAYASSHAAIFSSLGLDGTIAEMEADSGIFLEPDRLVRLLSRVELALPDSVDPSACQSHTQLYAMGGWWVFLGMVCLLLILAGFGTRWWLHQASRVHRKRR